MRSKDRSDTEGLIIKDPTPPQDRQLGSTNFRTESRVCTRLSRAYVKVHLVIVTAVGGAAAFYSFFGP